MNVVKCKKGHFYDSDKYAMCPHCENISAFSDNETVTVAKLRNQGNVDVTVDIPKKVSLPIDDEKTVGFWGVGEVGKATNEPCVGWLVCTKGTHFGEDYRLKSGKNFIGRDPSMDVCLSRESKVSRDKHAIIIYDPKQNYFLAQPGESSELFYLNGNLVVSPEKLTKGDRIELGDVELIFIPLCDDMFKWEKKED